MKLVISFLFTIQSKVNVASVGVRQIQKTILDSGFSRTVDVQVLHGIGTILNFRQYDLNISKFLS